MEDLVNDVLHSSPEGVNEAEIERLKDVQDSLQKAVYDHAAAVKAKEAELSQSLPLTKFEKEKLNLEKARDEATRKAEEDKLYNEKAKAEAAKALKLKKAEIDVDNLVSKIIDFESINNTIKPSKELSDY